MFLPRTVLFKDLASASKNRSGVVTCTISSGTFLGCVFSVLQIRGARLWTGIGGAPDARRSQLIVHREVGVHPAQTPLASERAPFVELAHRERVFERFLTESSFRAGLPGDISLFLCSRMLGLVWVLGVNL